jgi:hypothetical protein
LIYINAQATQSVNGAALQSERRAKMFRVGTMNVGTPGGLHRHEGKVDHRVIAIAYFAAAVIAVVALTEIATSVMFMAGSSELTEIAARASIGP